MRTRSSNSRMATPFANPERQFRARRDTLPALIHNIYTFYESESSESEYEDVAIKTLTLEQYLTLNLNNTRKRSSTENTIEHIGKVLEVASLFNINDFALLRVFPLTLVRVAKRWFNKTSPEHAKNWDELKQNFIQRFCPPAVILEQLGEIQKEPGSFILSCTINNTTVSNALADLEASISNMPFSLFKRLGLRNPEPINMVIEMADRSMQSPRGITENMLVKINKFIFPVDFIILDIIKDDKVPIILGRHMLATVHARIDVFGKKISLEVGTEQITFDINEKEFPAIILLICVINNFSKINEIDETRHLEELRMSDDIDGDLGLAKLNDDSSRMFCNPNSNSSISIDDFVEMDEVWDDLDFRALTNKATKSPVKLFLRNGNRIHLHNPYDLQITCKIRKMVRRLSLSWKTYYYDHGRPPCIVGGLDHVNLVTRLPLERRISRVLWLGDHPYPSVGTNPIIASTT
nr:hypothetical protein [Tanacetum cinerariifolium]